MDFVGYSEDPWVLRKGGPIAGCESFLRREGGHALRPGGSRDLGVRGPAFALPDANGSCRVDFRTLLATPSFGQTKWPDEVRLRSVVLEGQAGREDVLDQRGCGNKVLQPEVEDALQSLDAKRPQFGQLCEDATEVVSLLLCFVVVGDVIAKGSDDLHLHLLHPLRLFEAVAFWAREKESINYYEKNRI